MSWPQKDIREYYEQLYVNIEEMDKFIEKYSALNLNQEEIDDLNRLITRSKIESVFKKLYKQKSRKIWLQR